MTIANNVAMRLSHNKQDIMFIKNNNNMKNMCDISSK